MREVLRKIWFPLTIVVIATIQTFGMDITRTGSNQVSNKNIDTVIYNNSGVFTKFRKNKEKIASDTIGNDNLFGEEEKIISARDTIKAPDSLKYTDPFRYKYYVALLASLTHRQVRDSLKTAGDSLDLLKLDSIYYADSAILAKKNFLKWFRFSIKKCCI